MSKDTVVACVMCGHTVVIGTEDAIRPSDTHLMWNVREA